MRMRRMLGASRWRLLVGVSLRARSAREVRRLLRMLRSRTSLSSDSTGHLAEEGQVA